MKNKLFLFLLLTLLSGFVACSDDDKESDSDYTEGAIQMGDRVGTVSGQAGIVYFSKVHKRWYIYSFVDRDSAIFENYYYPATVPQQLKVEDKHITFSGETYKLIKPHFEQKDDIEHYGIVLTED